MIVADMKPAAILNLYRMRISIVASLGGEACPSRER